MTQEEYGKRLKMSEHLKNILCYQNKILPLWQYNASLCRKATFDVAHPVGQWSVSLWLAFSVVPGKSAWLETPMPVWAAPTLGISVKPCALSNIEIRFNDTNFGVDVFIQFFFQDCPLSSTSGFFLLNLVLVVESKTHRTKYQIKELQWEMFGGIDFDDVILSNLNTVSHKVFVIIQFKNKPLELTNLCASCRNIINIQSYIPILYRQVAIFESETVFYELIVKDRELVFFLFMREYRWFVLVIPKEDTNLSFSLIQQIKYEIYNPLVLLKGVEIYFLPFNFFLDGKFVHQITQAYNNLIIISTINQYPTIEIGEILTVLIAFIKPYINHCVINQKTSAPVSVRNKVTLCEPTSEAELNIFRESVTNHLIQN